MRMRWIRNCTRLVSIPASEGNRPYPARISLSLIGRHALVLEASMQMYA